MARGTQLAVWLDLKNNPLGRRSNENFNVAQNYQIPPARIYMINHSRTKERKQLVVPMSHRRGAEEVLIYDKKKGGGELVELYNVELLYRAQENGRDMSRYEMGIKPVVFAFKVGGKTIAIPPAENDKSEPARKEVPEGAWDLFLGNYDRMRGYNPVPGVDGRIKERGEPDPIVISEERNRLAISWRQRHNPVFRFTDDGVSTDINNEFGFIEFVREVQVPATEMVDKEYLTALDLIEV